MKSYQQQTNDGGDGQSGTGKEFSLCELNESYKRETGGRLGEVNRLFLRMVG